MTALRTAPLAPRGAARLLPPRPPRWPRPHVASWYGTAVLVLSTGAPFPLLSADGASHPLVQPLWLCAYALAACLLVDGVLRGRLRFTAPPFVLGFCALAAASTFWSVAPDLSLRRAVALAGTVTVALALAQRFTAVEVLECTRRAVLIVAVASLLLYAVGDPRALDEVHQTLQGVLASKNTLGRVIALGLLSTVCVSLLAPERRRRCAVGAVPMVLALLLSRSAAGLVVSLAVLAAYVLARLAASRRGRPALVALFAVLAGLTTVAAPALTLDALAGALGRDATLTGRTDIWSMSLEAAQRRPVVGYGYGAFWHPDGAAEARQIQDRLHYEVPHAHNGLLDVGLELGTVGTLLALAVVVALFVHALDDLRVGRREQATARLAVGALVVLSNLVESSFLDENHSLTIVLVAVLAATPGDPVAPRASRRPA